MTIAPDEGLRQLVRRITARPRGGGEFGPEPGDGQYPERGGTELEIGARLVAVLDRMESGQRQARRPGVPWEAAHPVEISPGANAAAGTIDQPDQWGPRSGWSWHVSWLTVQLLAGTTLVSLYRDGANNPAALVAQFSASSLYEPRALWLHPQNRLVAVSAGGGCVIAGQAIEVAREWMPEYIL